MMHLTEEQKRQLRIIDDYLRYADLNDLQRRTSEAMTVEKLKGAEAPLPSVIDALVTAMEFQETEVYNLRQQVHDLQNDIQALVRIAKKEQQASMDNTTDIDSLSSRHGIW